MKNILKNTIALAGVILLSPALNAGDYSSGKEPYGKEVIPACDSYYIEVFGGFSFPDTLEFSDLGQFAMDEGWNAGASIGTGLTERIDIEFEVFYTATDYIADNTDLTSLGLNVNAFYNIPLGEKLTAYVGAGVGALNVHAQDDHDSAWVFGYQFIGGFRYALTPCMDVFTEYRYLDSVDNSINLGANSYEYNSNDVSFGVRFKF